MHLSFMKCLLMQSTSQESVSYGVVTGGRLPELHSRWRLLRCAGMCPDHKAAHVTWLPAFHDCHGFTCPLHSGSQHAARGRSFVSHALCNKHDKQGMFARHDNLNLMTSFNAVAGPGGCLLAKAYYPLHAASSACKN